MNAFRLLPRIVSTTSRCCLRTPMVTKVQLPRYFATNISLPPDIDFDELNKKLETNEITLIDVRPPAEINDVGMIPKSKNVMVQTIGPYILLPDDEFAEKTGFEKPGLNDPLVITCLLGIRARTAQLAMLAVGYKNVRVYAGSFTDWREKGGEVVFPDTESEK